MQKEQHYFFTDEKRLIIASLEFRFSKVVVLSSCTSILDADKYIDFSYENIFKILYI